MRSRVARHLRYPALAGALILVISCNRGATPSSSSSVSGPVRGGILTASLRSEPPTFNRLAPNAQHAAVDLVTRLAHAPLVRLNRVTEQPEPWLAEKWTVSADGRVQPPSLRERLPCAAGVPP